MRTCSPYWSCLPCRIILYILYVLQSLHRVGHANARKGILHGPDAISSVFELLWILRVYILWNFQLAGRRR